MNILLKFLLISFKYICDAIGDFLYLWNIILFPMNVDAIIESQPEEVRKDLEENKAAKKNLYMWCDNLFFKNYLPASARLFAKNVINNTFRTRHNILRTLASDPSIKNVPLKRPVFIVTLMRTGSTFLHCLMDQDQRWRCPRLWELEVCGPSPGADANLDLKREKASKFQWG